MSERPTPEEIVSDRWERSTVLDDLAAHGYVIAHPDDVPVKCPEGERPATNDPLANLWVLKGWNACRDRIFGGGK